MFQPTHKKAAPRLTLTLSSGQNNPLLCSTNFCFIILFYFWIICKTDKSFLQFDQEDMEQLQNMGTTGG